jgi:glycine/D-amino acid oxidase-like deaminating enzyme
MGFDVAIVGGGIIGTAAATYLAEAGQSVVLLEQSELAAGASGRNSGALQHPYDPALARLHAASLPLYAELAAIEPRFELARVAAGLLLVSRDEAALAGAAADLAELPELAARFVPAADAHALEPALAEGVAAVLLATGYPVAPQAATLAFARRATRTGAELRVGAQAWPAFEGDRAVGVRVASGELVAAGQVLVAAGPWTAALLDGWRDEPPIRRSWGVVVSTRLAAPPRHILEQHGIDAGGSAEETAFSLVTAGGSSSVGSTFLADEPDPAAWAARLIEGGARFVPALSGARVIGLRACSRPVGFDNRPLIGALPAVDGLFVCAGHGPWGMSTGPASARMVVDSMLGGPAAVAIADELAASRWPWRPPASSAEALT